jgi:hypothetical protein
MAPSTRSHDDRTDDRSGTPRIRACERSPGTTVFLEDGNRDGWISTDHTVEPWE